MSIYDSLKERIEELKDYEISESDFNDLLEETAGENVDICGMTYYLPYVFKCVDEVAYSMAMREEEDRVKSDKRDELSEDIGNAWANVEINDKQQKELFSLLNEAF